LQDNSYVGQEEGKLQKYVRWLLQPGRVGVIDEAHVLLRPQHSELLDILKPYLSEDGGDSTGEHISLIMLTTKDEYAKYCRMDVRARTHVSS